MPTADNVETTIKEPINEAQKDYEEGELHDEVCDDICAPGTTAEHVICTARRIFIGEG